MTEFFEPIMKWIVAPLAAIVVWLLNKSTSLDTEVKILDAKMESQIQRTQANEEGLRITMGQVLSRLDSIDRHLRNGNGKGD